MRKLKDSPPRPLQLEIIGLIKDGIERNDYKHIFLQGPTGDGKSLIAMTVASYFRSLNKSFYLLSMDLGLTAQYKRDFPFLKEVKGRSNFRCVLPGFSGVTADKAPCVVKTEGKMKVCPVKDDCPYVRQREDASMSMSTVSTPYYIDRCVPNNFFGRRFLSIRDEAHKLEKFYLGMFSFHVSIRDYKLLYDKFDLPRSTDPSYWSDELHRILETIQFKIPVTTDVQLLQRLEAIQDRVLSILEHLIENDNVVITRKEKWVEFQPVVVNSLVPDVIDSVSDHTLYMSATFLSVKERIKDLGLDPDDCLYINKKDSNFPSSNRHLNFHPVGSMSYKLRNTTLPKIIDKCFSLITLHSAQRGVIVCGSHAIRDNLYHSLCRLHNPSLLVTHGPTEFKEALDKFLMYRSKPMVFITTRFEGLDFHGKLAEYLIYVNLPYPPITDKQIVARLGYEQRRYLEKNGDSCGFELDVDGKCKKSSYCVKCRRWYDLQVAESLQQALGRVIRTPTDEGWLYILDSRFKRFYGQRSDMFLSYLREDFDKLPELV
jgi:Rad3-related DNA helicase